jgi:hypothetical protein
MVSYNCGVASIFGQQQAHNNGNEHALIQYVGVLLRLDYGPISIPIIFMQYAMCMGSKWE